jgi:hypothetical protein
MTRVRFTLSQIMAATGIAGTAMGLLARFPDSLMPMVVLLVLPITFIAVTCYAIYFVAHLTPKYRLAIESATLIALVGLSTLIWRPGFYTDEESRCLELAQKATAAKAYCPGVQIALDREAAWFKRRAAELRWRGLWLGLTLGPKTRDDAAMCRRSLTYELGTLESMEKHEKAVRRLNAAGSCPDE